MFYLTKLPNAIPGENVVLFLRQHWINLFQIIVGYLIAIAFPLGVFFYLEAMRPELLADPILFPFIVMGLSLFFLFSWLFLFMTFLDYYLDIWIVTDKRIISIEQTGLFGRTVSELRLYRIQDVTATVQGFIPTAFGFGDVEIQTAGETPRFSFDRIPNPNAVAQKIMEMSECARRKNTDIMKEDLALDEEKTKT